MRKLFYNAKIRNFSQYSIRNLLVSYFFSSYSIPLRRSNSLSRKISNCNSYFSFIYLSRSLRTASSSAHTLSYRLRHSEDSLVSAFLAPSDSEVHFSTISNSFFNTSGLLMSICENLLWLPILRSGKVSSSTSYCERSVFGNTACKSCTLSSGKGLRHFQRLKENLATISTCLRALSA